MNGGDTPGGGGGPIKLDKLNSVERKSSVERKK